MITFYPVRIRIERGPARYALLRCSFLGAIAVLAAISAAGQTSGTVTVQLRAMTPHVNAYAQVEPISTLPVSAAEAGVLSGLKVVPGMHVYAGEVLAQLQGPSIRALLLQNEANLRSARTQLSAAQKSLAIQREQLRAHLSTREAEHQTESALAQAQTTVDNAESGLTAIRQMAAIIAPSDATVIALNTSNGELVNAGQPIVTLQPAHSLWLRASFYGRDYRSIHIGMIGQFSPSNGSASIPVCVRAIFGVADAGGGESVAITPLHGTAQWLNGESGTVTLNSPQRRMVSVPTRALILNQGKWWVMVHTARGDHPQQVVPGPAQGWNTFIERGLASGSQVIVNNAYLLFHASIDEHYQIPD